MDAQAEASRHPAPLRHESAAAEIVFILVGGPAAWFAQLVVAYLLATHACFPHVEPAPLPMTGWLSPVLAAIIGLALLVSLVALGTAQRLWRRTRGEARGAHKGALNFGEGRTRFLALVGVIVNGLFALACMFAIAAYLLVPLCT